MSYYKDEDFKNDQLGSYERPNQAKGYIDSLYKNFLLPNGLGEIVSDLENAMQINSKKVKNRLEKLNTILKKVIEKEKKDSGSFYFNHRNVNSFESWLTVFEKYVKYIKQHDIKNNKSTKKIMWLDKWDKTLDLLDCQTKAIDGISSLVGLLGSKRRFIKETLENSIFMNPHEVVKRFDELSNHFNTKSLLHARKSNDANIQSQIQGTWYFHYKDLSGNSQTVGIIRDKDGNAEARDQIKSLHNHIVSQGANSNIINYKISHIWQNAFDPRFFTNLWNIVLVPIWANDLLDKTKFRNLFILQLVNTFKAVCFDFYKMDNLDWPSIQMECPNYDKTFVIREDYSIQYFEGGEIKKVTITVN